jgi:hypothetical protein
MYEYTVHVNVQSTRELTTEQIEELVSLCDTELEDNTIVRTQYVYHEQV